MSVQDGFGTTVYETEYLEAHCTSDTGKGYIVTTKKCVICGEEPPYHGMPEHLRKSDECRETLLKRLES